MIRALAIGCCVLLAGCASPVVTRVDAVAPAPLPARSSFTLVSAPGETSPVSSQATAMIAAGLTQRGWTQGEAGDYLLSVTLSDRPATSQLQAGDDAGKPRAIIGPAPDRKTTKGCAQRDHRLAIRLTHRTTGEDLYSGSGAEFHCKAGVNDSLPHLVSAALDGLDGPKGARMAVREGVR